MNASGLKTVVDRTFQAIEGLPVLRRLVRVREKIESFHAAVNADIDAVAVGLPENAPTNVIIDTIFAFLETKFPAEKFILEWLRVIADALFAAAPVVI